MTHASLLATRPPPTQGHDVPTVETPTRTQLLLAVAAALAKHGSVSFGGLYTIEHRHEDEVRRMTLVNTAFEPVDQALGDAGIPTNGTVGGIMDALDLTKEQVHELICNCKGEIVSGDVVAERFRKIVSG